MYIFLLLFIVVIVPVYFLKIFYEKFIWFIHFRNINNFLSVCMCVYDYVCVLSLTNVRCRNI